MIFAAYHRNGVQLDILQEISRITRNGSLPFILVADFNDEHVALENTGWLNDVKAVIIGPYEGTCKSSKAQSPDGRCIDYVVASGSVAPLIRGVTVDWCVLFSPHFALIISMSRDTSKLVEEGQEAKDLAQNIQ